MVEEKLNKPLYKIELLLIKLIPILLALLTLLNVVLSYLNIDVELLSAIGGMSLLPWLFFYVSSFAFRFCIYHRMFLHYALVNNIISTLEFTVGLPVSFLGLCCIFSINFCVFLFLILYYRKKERRCCNS